ncbi:MAG: mannose-1-phosphate guanylyltransferase/mannose-6-phosphate isomerase [Shimia sp.]
MREAAASFGGSAAAVRPVLLAGGVGTRLWPLSRAAYPKQFQQLGTGLTGGAATLFEAALGRVAPDSGGGPGGGGGDAPAYLPPLVLTAAPYRFLAAEGLAAAGVAPGAILLEPEGRDTAAAVTLAALAAAEGSAPAGIAPAPDVPLLICPCDHLIPDAAAFRAAVAAALPDAHAGRIVTFGIAPDRAETGYGWLELGEPRGAAPTIPLARFVEKPDAARAAAMLAAGSYLWNAGIFLATPRALLAAVAAHAPGVVPPVRAALAGAVPDLGFVRLAPGPWADAPRVSVDYAVMEPAAAAADPALAVMPYAGAWSDLGDWEAVHRVARDGPRDNAATGPAVAEVVAQDCEGTLLHGGAPGQALVGIGLRDVVAVALPDAVLVADRSRVQDAKAAVAALARAGAPQAEGFPKDHRPWGWFERLALGPRFQVKRLHVHPGAALSLQSHLHRAEHWVVVAGTAEVTLGDEVRHLREDEGLYIAPGARHRLANPGRVPVELIEVQTGGYLGEDDIARHEDAYHRG